MAKLFGRAIINQNVTVYSGGTAFVSDEIVGNGEAQVVAHNLPFTPTKVLVLPSNLPGGSTWDYEITSTDDTNITIVATLGVTYRVFAWTGAATTTPLPFLILQSEDGTLYKLTTTDEGVLNTEEIV